MDDHIDHHCNNLNRARQGLVQQMAPYAEQGVNSARGLKVTDSARRSLSIWFVNFLVPK